MMKRLAAIATAALLVAAGCDAVPPSTSPSVAARTAAPASSSRTPTIALPAVAEWHGICIDVGITSTLAGDPADPRIAWLEDAAGRQEIVFPPGFRARFDPDLEVLNASGEIVMRAGDTIHGACVVGERNTADEPLLISSTQQ